jgi:ComEC/Rec2-related protein
MVALKSQSPAARTGWFETMPAVPATLWLCLGILMILPAGEPRTLAWRLPLLLGLASLLWLYSHRRHRTWGWCFPLGLGLAWLHLASPWQTYLRQLPAPECHGWVRGTVVAVRPATVPGATSRCRLDLQAVAFLPETWQPGRGQVELLIAGGVPPPRRGDRIETDGAFLIPAEAMFSGDFSYRGWLEGQGIRRQVSIRSFQRIGKDRIQAFLATLDDLRDAWERKLAGGIASTDGAVIVAALVLGSREGLSPEMNQAFLRTGTIHILSVSGMHTAIAALILLAILRLARVPYGAMHLTLIPALGGYVLLTGMAPAAARAWLMIALWAWSKAFFRHVPALNSVAASALILLMLNPFLIVNNGFLFSYTVVLSLLLGWPWLRHISTVLQERRLWIPVSARGRPGWTAGLVMLLGGTWLAWLGGAGLTAWYNRLLLPASAWPNLVAAQLSLPLLGAAFLKLFLCWIPPVDAALAWILNLLLGILEATVRTGAASTTIMAIAQPALWLIAGYYLCLLILLILPAYRLPAGAGLIFAGLLLAAPWRQPPTGATVMTGGGLTTPVAILRDPGRPARVFLPAGATATRLATAELSRQGDRVDTLVYLTLPRATGTGNQRFETLFAPRRIVSHLTPSAHPGQTPPECDGTLGIQRQGGFGEREWRILSGNHRLIIQELAAGDWQVFFDRQSCLLPRRNYPLSVSFSETMEASATASSGGSSRSLPGGSP